MPCRLPDKFGTSIVSVLVQLLVVVKCDSGWGKSTNVAECASMMQVKELFGFESVNRSCYE